MSNLAAAPHDPHALVVALAWLRACAVAGQVATVLIVAHGLHLPIAENLLLAGSAALAGFGLFVLWRLRQPWPVGEAEAVAHLTVDTGVLCYLLYLTGGATNPFVSLYIVPIALASMALSPPYLACSALIACGAYLLVLFRYAPLPDIHRHGIAGIDLHMLGVAVNFAIGALLLGFFIRSLARELRASDESAQLERERVLRDEGILAIAAQAAGTAHELNTPLSTIHTLLGELRRDHPEGTPLGDDLALLAGQTSRCHAILRELVQFGSRHLADEAEIVPLDAFVRDCAERFRLLRPQIDLELAFGCSSQPAAASQTPRNAAEDAGARLRVVPALHHALINLLNNAADASLSMHSAKVELRAKHTGAYAEIAVRDFGPGLPAAVHAAGGRRFVTGKRDGMGLGLGLALTNATTERLHGRLIADAATDGGTRTRLILPLA